MAMPSGVKQVASWLQVACWLKHMEYWLDIHAYQHTAHVWMQAFQVNQRPQIVRAHQLIMDWKLMLAQKRVEFDLGNSIFDTVVSHVKCHLNLKSANFIDSRVFGLNGHAEGHYLMTQFITSVKSGDSLLCTKKRHLFWIRSRCLHQPR